MGTRRVAWLPSQGTVAVCRRVDQPHSASTELRRGLRALHWDSHCSHRELSEQVAELRAGSLSSSRYRLQTHVRIGMRGQDRRSTTKPNAVSRTQPIQDQYLGEDHQVQGARHVMLAFPIGRGGRQGGWVDGWMDGWETLPTGCVCWIVTKTGQHGRLRQLVPAAAQLHLTSSIPLPRPHHSQYVCFHRSTQP